MNTQTKGLLITTLGVLLVVPDSLFVRLIDADAWTIAFWRQLLAGGLLMLLLFLWQGAAPFRAVAATGRYGAIYTVGVGASGLTFTLAVSLTSVANVVFIIASLPVFAAVFSRIYLSEPLRPRMVFTMLAVAAGLAVIAYGSSETERSSFAGDALALATSAMFAAALTAARKVRATSMVPAAAMGYVGCSVLILPFAAPLSIAPDQVRAPLPAQSGGSPPAELLFPEGGVHWGCMSEDLATDGYIGAPALANREMGDKIVQHAGVSLARLVHQITNADWQAS